MKKIIVSIVVLFTLFPIVANADIDYNYNYNGNVYNIYYPENIESLEYKYLTGELSKDNKWYTLIYLNVSLVKRGLNPIW